MSHFYYQQLQIAKNFLSIFYPIHAGYVFCLFSIYYFNLKIFFLSIEVGAQTTHLLLHTAAQQKIIITPLSNAIWPVLYILFYIGGELFTII